MDGGFVKIGRSAGGNGFFTGELINYHQNLYNILHQYIESMPKIV